MLTNTYSGGEVQDNDDTSVPANSDGGEGVDGLPGVLVMPKEETARSGDHGVHGWWWLEIETQRRPIGSWRRQLPAGFRRKGSGGQGGARPCGAEGGEGARRR